MKKLLIAVASMLLGGCATHGNWAPTVDTYGDTRTQYISQDQAECRQLALQAAGGTAQNTLSGAVVGGLIGAGAGAAIGAVVANPAAGAAIGAAAGGIGGGATGGVSTQRDFKAAYRSCMRGRGHNVVGMIGIPGPQG